MAGSEMSLVAVLRASVHGTVHGNVINEGDGICADKRVPVTVADARAA
jgi:hypothetical protein